MSRGGFPSRPPSQPSPYRYLGRGGGERPVRVQIIIALVAGLILVAVPLYLWRRPQPESIPSADAAVVDSSLVTLDAEIPPEPQDEKDDGLLLSPFSTLSCKKPGKGKTAPEDCDRVPFFEDALARAIRESKACAPSSKTNYKVSFVYKMSFRKKDTELTLGASTTIKKAKAKELLTCIKRALPEDNEVDWERLPHDHTLYTINVMVTYPPNETF